MLTVSRTAPVSSLKPTKATRLAAVQPPSLIRCLPCHSFDASCRVAFMRRPSSVRSQPSPRRRSSVSYITPWSEWPPRRPPVCCGQRRVDALATDRHPSGDRYPGTCHSRRRCTKGQLNVPESDGFHDIADTLRGRSAQAGDEASNCRRRQWRTKPPPRLEAGHRIDHIFCVIDSSVQHRQ